MSFIFKLFAIFCIMYLFVTVGLPFLFGFMFYIAVFGVIVYLLHVWCKTYLG